MEVRYYQTALGVFTVAVGDDVFSGVNALSNGELRTAAGVDTALLTNFRAVFPCNGIVGHMFRGTGTVTIDTSRLGSFQEVLPGISIKEIANPGSTTVTTDYVIPGFSSRMIRTNARNLDLANKPYYINFFSWFRLGTDNIQAYSNVTPYGVAQLVSSNSTLLDYFKMGVLYANSAMTQFGYAEISCGANQKAVNLNKGQYSNSSNSLLTLFFDGIPPITPGGDDGDDPYSGIDGEDEITGGGTGVVGIPGFPGLTATATGIIGLFAPSAAEMQALASFMWTDFGGQGTTTEDILKEIVEAIKRSISNPLDYVIGLNIIPSQGLSIGSASTIRFGFISSGVSMPRLSNQYFTVDCGTIDFDPLCGDTFLDYAPYSKFSIYLPYIGVKEVDANDFVGHTIGVVYHGDTVTGGVTAYITKDGSVMYQYSGCCALNIPLSADNWGNTISGAVQIATAIAGTAISGSPAGVVAAAAKQTSSVAANPSLLSPQVSHSGAVSGGAGCMGVQYPFVIREAVRFHSTDGFNTISGYPSFYYRQLAEMSGYTSVIDVHLSGISGTQEEIAEIETLLKGGVII